MLKNTRVGLIKLFFRAAAGFFAVALLFTSAAFASVTVLGVPEWVRPTIVGPVEAVWGEVGQAGTVDQKKHTLELVIGRLFPGLAIREVRILGKDLLLDLSLESQPEGEWGVRIEIPALAVSLRSLFLEDIGNVSDILSDMIAPIGTDSLSWAGRPFQGAASALLSECLPGWSPSFLFMQSGEGSLEVVIRFQALPPVVVAFSPRISSRTLPRMLQSEITDDALEVLSPFIGLPAEWVKRHANRIEDLASSLLESKWATREMKGKVSVGITPERIAPVDVRVESERYTLQAWGAISVGSDERHPELGVHFGRKTLPFPKWEMELYGEWIARANDLRVESRWGARWSTWMDIWVGAEVAYPGGDIWYRFWLDEIIPKIYLWGRLTEDGDSTGALGWRFGEYLSGELYYDSRDGDGLRVRIIGNL